MLSFVKLKHYKERQMTFWKLRPFLKKFTGFSVSL
jgi:hypothetical protein